MNPRRGGASIRTKLMAYFLVLSILPLSTLGVLGPLMYARSVEQEATSHTVQMIGQVSRGIEFHVREMEKVIQFLSLDAEVAGFFGGTAAGGSARLRAVLGNFRQSHPEIAGILLVDARDQPFSADLERVTRDPLTDEPWYRKAESRPDSIQLFSRPIGRNIRSKDGYSADEIVSVAKAMRDPANGTVSGVVLVDLRVSVIEDQFEDTSLGQKGFLFVSDDQGGIVYAPRNDVIYRIPVEAVFDTSRPRHMSLGGTGNPGGGIAPIDYQIISQQSAYTGWITSAVISLDETLREVVSLRVYSLAIGGLTLTLAIIAAFFFTASVARPVIALEQLMKRAEAGDLAVRFTGRGDDEISHLGGSFNAMLTEIGNLIDQVYRDQQLQREAELRILQEQIKPHFLYNTLDTIQWLAREHGANDIVCVVESLTTLFRIGLSRGREVIPLSRELEHVRSYLCIQKARYEDKFEWSMEVDESLQGFNVIKLILQPLVENAIYHGIKERRGPGHLTVRVWREGETLLMRVSDDGVGIGDERLDELNRRLAEEDGREGDTGYGIFNVNDRIRLRFGADYGLRFVRTGLSGCTVEIRHPLCEEVP